MSDVEKRIKAIESRNRRVEADKAWETSQFRRLTITMLTYIVVGLYLTVVDFDRPWLSSVVPALGYYLSTVVLAFARRIWAQNR